MAEVARTHQDDHEVKVLLVEVVFAGREANFNAVHDVVGVGFRGQRGTSPRGRPPFVADLDKQVRAQADTCGQGRPSRCHGPGRGHRSARDGSHDRPTRPPRRTLARNTPVVHDQAPRRRGVPSALWAFRVSASTKSLVNFVTQPSPAEMETWCRRCRCRRQNPISMRNVSRAPSPHGGTPASNKARQMASTPSGAT